MLTFNPRVDGYYNVENQLIEYLRRRAERCFRNREQERDALTSVAEFEAYRGRMKEHFLTAIGGLPEERTDLNEKLTGTIDRGSYEIRKIIYESVPNFPVTSALYMPKSRIGQPPGPAVLFVCGHALEAKAYARYQQVCIDLALDGFVVLAMDPPGQGERFQFIDPHSGEQKVRWGTTEHSYAGLQYYIAGMSIARQFTWDAIRGIDYLISLPEVDEKRVGVTGNSGGGTQSAFLMLAEPRLAAAMPCTFIMDYENYMKTGQGQDGEQNLYASFLEGPDHDDYITAMAPKPVRMGLAAYDFFPIEGALASIEKAQKIYALYGKGNEAKVDYEIANTTHQYSPQLRQAAVNFFRKTLRGEAETFVTGEPEALPPEELNATETGQVLSSFLSCRTVSDLLREELQKQLPASPASSAPDAIRERVASVLGIGPSVPAGEACWKGEPRERTIYPRIIVDRPEAGYRTEKIFYFSEPDIVSTAVLVHPSREDVVSGTEVLLLEGGTAGLLEERARIVSTLEQGRNVCVIDVRGVGALRSSFVGGNYAHLGTEFKLGCDAFKMKTSTLGLRVFDVLRGLDYLRTRADCGPVSLTGVGPGAAWALYAAVLDPDVAGLTIERMPLSYRAMASARFYDPGTIDFRSVAWGQLRAGDVVDLLPALAPRPMKVVTPLSPEGIPLTDSEVNAEFIGPATEVGNLSGGSGAWRPMFSGLGGPLGPA